jgi:hypothetical protein
MFLVIKEMKVSQGEIAKVAILLSPTIANPATFAAGLVDFPRNSVWNSPCTKDVHGHSIPTPDC